MKSGDGNTPALKKGDPVMLIADGTSSLFGFVACTDPYPAEIDGVPQVIVVTPTGAGDAFVMIGTFENPSDWRRATGEEVREEQMRFAVDEAASEAIYRAGEKFRENNDG